MLIIYGGSFNPPTKAHLDLVNKIKGEFKTARIIIVPVSSNNYTWKHNLVDNKYRYDMLKLQFKDLEISKYEFAKKKYTGTYELLNDFKQIDSDIYFLIGSDNLKQMPEWLNFNNLIKDFNFIVVKRPSDEIDFRYVLDYVSHFKVVEMDNEISSTKIREDINKYKDWLIPEVYDYIKKNKLYEVDKKC